MMRHMISGLVVAALLLLATAVQAQSVSRSTFRVLEQAQELMGEERYEEARTGLEAILSKTAEDPYDFAVVNQYVAHVSVLMEDFDRARSALEAGLASPELPSDIRTEMNLFYGTVLLGQEEYDLARIALEEWLAADSFPTPNQLFTVSYANYMSGKLARSEPLIARAIGESAEPKKSWYQLYYRVLFELKKFDGAEKVLLGMVSRDPTKKQLWRMLASHYLQLERATDALAALMIAHGNELIDGEKDLEQIVSLYSYIDVPEKSAGAFRESAILAPDGRTYELLGGIYFEDEDWSEAHSAYQEAIKIGGLEEPLRVSLLAGISAFRAGRNDDARKSLTAAAESDEYRPQAESLLRKLN